MMTGSATAPRLSLRTAFAQRLLVVLLLTSVLAGGLSMIFLKSLNHTVAEQQLKGEAMHVEAKLHEIEINRELEAIRLVSLMEFANVLEAADRQRMLSRFTAFVTSLGTSNNFSHLLLVDATDRVVASYPDRSKHLVGFHAPLAQTPEWKFDAQDHTLYRVISRPVLLAGNPGRLLCYAPMDNALVSKIGSPGTDIHVNWQGIVVARSGPKQGVRDEIDDDIRASMPLKLEGIAPEILITHKLILPVSKIALFAIVFFSLLVMLLTTWIAFGHWISSQLRRFKALETAFVYFSEGQSITSEVSRKIGQAAGRTTDEISDFCTNAKALMQSIEASKLIYSRLTSIIENSTDAIFSRDMRGTILTWNQSAEQIFGYNEKEVIGHPIWKFLPSSSPEVVLENNERLMRGEQIKLVELDLFDKSGRTFNVLGSLSPIKASDGNITSVSCLMQDVTQRKKAERARFEIELKLQEAQRLQTIGNLTGGFAHHFNNLLGVILGNIELALNQMDDMEETQKRLKLIENFALRAADLVHQLMTFAQIAPTQRSPVDLAKLATATTEQLRPGLPPHLSLEVQCEGTPTVLGDSRQLERVLINLCKNAEEAIGSEPGHIRIRLDTVNIDAGLLTSPVEPGNLPGERLAASASMARIAVSDTGPGMNEQVLKRIWEPFYTSKEIGTGSGLGLPMVLGIVKTHEGRIEVESGSGKGTTFTVYIPLHNSMPTVAEGVRIFV